ncbi:hypothetical protein ACHAW5_003681 [Stephanodiscus triporus]|uniref:CBF1-interacting co-repressor CIR N-terminal domain-containing protein n=1 Tax=Stephanodiscus triporus TaxID=2934178 RepID=A0ABD3QHY4_9STRA
MPGLSFLSKKSWHTSNLSNQEKVWIAEQKAESESRKMAELREQIKVEREREEFDRLTKGDAVGDRGTNWMYEGGGAAAATVAREEEDARRNEAYLLGKEYVPDGKARHSGDFVEASTMTGALEKASTFGAMIGAGYANKGEGAMKLRIQEDATTTSSAAADGGDGVNIHIDDKDKDWSQNFHLRHEDPMFAVHQRRQAQLKDAEKKKRLLERAGLDVFARRDFEGANEYSEHRKEEASEGDDDDDGYSGRHKRKRRGRSKSEKMKKRSRREGEHRRRRHSKSKRDHHKRRNSNRDDDDRSSSSSTSYSSSSASMSSGRRRRHCDGRDGRKGQYDRRRRKADEYDYNDRRRNRDSSSRRERSRSRSRSRSGSRRNIKQTLSSAPSPSRTCNNDDETRGAVTERTRGRYGLVGTSLSNKDNNDGTSIQYQLGGNRHDGYLGPDKRLLESKRQTEAEERERVRQISRKGSRR